MWSFFESNLSFPNNFLNQDEVCLKNWEEKARQVQAFKVYFETETYSVFRRGSVAQLAKPKADIFTARKL